MSDSFASDDVVDIMAAFLSVFQGPHLRQLNWCLRSPQLLGPLWDPLGYLQRGAFQLLQWLLLNSLLWVSCEAGWCLGPRASLSLAASEAADPISPLWVAPTDLRCRIYSLPRRKPGSTGFELLTIHP